MSAQNKLPVHEPDLGEEEIQSVLGALRRGEISGSFGKAIPEFEEQFAAFCGCKYGVAVTSGTAALQVAVAAAGIGRGDEILMSASTNIATALAAYHNGANSVAVDSEPVTWNLDPDLIERLITPRTKAIIPVHLFGHPCDMDRIMAVARRHNLTVIEDCAESHGATWQGRMTGSFGDMACFSFYANKIITTGEGGMVVTNDPALGERLRLLRNLGFGKPRFYHEVPAYNFRMTGMQAALGLAQLAKIDRFIAQKRTVAATYNELLANIPGIQTPAELPGAMNVYWMYAIVIGPEFGRTRDELATILLEQGIETRTFFCPMNLQPFLRAQEGHRDVGCPVAERLWQDGFYLPSANQLDRLSIARVCEAIAAARR
ncbi:DegT/DnrJ/EryC1/StrS family aminotransferase [Bradyrhizobium sp. HKCCYLS20291]|uniref:DegT/DnrJ/EryC1/StrS family aminotransferase n=1 Tax=Bradyrhizobium sp. HKCCYLS20291 TaxID=3420766 RepID=UPI003EBAA03E